MADENDPAILTYENTTLFLSDLKLIDPPHFLNDRLLGFYFEYFFVKKNLNMVSICFFNCSDSFLEKEVINDSNILFLNPSTAFLLAFLESTYNPNSNSQFMFLERERIILLHSILGEDEIKETLASLQMHSRLAIIIPVNDNENVTRAGGSHWFSLCISQILLSKFFCQERE